MKLLFNKASQGQSEVKALLGFFDADIKYKNLETDVELNTPYLVQFIGQEMYDKLEEFYNSDQTEIGADALKAMLKSAQLYILLMAYLEFASNGDIIHGNSGRKIHFATDQKTPWDWQIKADNGALERRAYKALDRLIDLLNTSTFAEWKDSDQYKLSKSLFVSTTNEFHKIYPINFSGQLYYRLVPFMDDIEKESILSILGADKFNELKTAIDIAPNSEDAQLLQYAKKITTYLAMDQAIKMFPEEMLNDKVDYKISEKERENSRQYKCQFIQTQVKNFERELEKILAVQNAEEYSIDQLHGIKKENKHVNL